MATTDPRMPDVHAADPAQHATGQHDTQQGGIAPLIQLGDPAGCRGMAREAPQPSAISVTTGERPMTVMEAIRTRRTIRRFKPDPVPERVLYDLIDAARWAPTACNMQLWDFVVVTDPARLAEIAQAVPHVKLAPAAIFACYNKEFSQGSAGGIQSTAAAIENVLLYAHSIGLGGYWVATVDDLPLLRKLLGLPPQIEFVSTVLVGYPDEQPSAPRRWPVEDLLHWQRYRPRTFLPTSPDPDRWSMEQIRQYQMARIRSGARYNKPVRSEYAALVSLIGGRLRDLRPQRWLDLFPCTGLYLEALCDAYPDAQEVAFVELSEQTAEFVQKRTKRPLVYYEYNWNKTLPFKDGTLDVVTCIFRLEGLPKAQQVRVLFEAGRALKPDGRLLLAFVNRFSYFSLMRTLRGLYSQKRRTVEYILAPDPSLGPFKPLDPAQVRAMCRQGGLVLERDRRLFPLPPADEVRHRVRNFSEPFKKLQYPALVLSISAGVLTPLLRNQSKIYVWELTKQPAGR